MKRVLIALVLLGICLYFLFFRLGSYGLLETTDARYAEIGWEMFQSKDFIFLRAGRLFPSGRRRKPAGVSTLKLDGSEGKIRVSSLRSR